MFSAIFVARQQPTAAQIPIKSEPVAKIVYPPTEDRGAPSRTTGSGSRDQCAAASDSKDKKLTALTPLNNISTTVNPNPTLYFYIPITESTPAELTIYNWTNRDRTPVYQTQLTLDSTPGIVKITLPETVALEANQTYAWNLSLYCDSNSTVVSQYVDGWLERVSLPTDTQAELQQLKKPLAVAQFYAEAGIWHETLDVLTQLRSTHPQVWKEFLSSVGLKHLEQYPLIESNPDSQAIR
ncbi:MAG: DUF928 domain-containing protein [Microcoleaceae cyanobacterium]